MRIRRLTIALALAALLAGAGLAGAQPKPCDIGTVPAATLLVPYFVASAATPPDANTFLAVVNPTATTRIAHFTLWTDYAIPTASFDVVLTPNDVQTLDLNSLLLVGPNPGSEVSGCQGDLRPGTLHLNASLGTAATLDDKLALLRLAHTGATLPVNKVAGSPREEAIGYVTIDVVNRCTLLFPSSTGYFKKGGTGVASDANALVGDVFWTDHTAGSAAGEPMVHVRAHPTAFKSGQYTFYGRYVSGKATDDRQPLGRIFGNRYLLGPLGNSQTSTLLLVWRDTKSPATSLVAVGTKPSWAYLPVRSFLYWDEEEHVQGGTIPLEELGLATQALDVGTSGVDVVYPFGWMRMDLGHRKTALSGLNAQAWVTVIEMADNFPNTGTTAVISVRGFILQGLCNP